MYQIINYHSSGFSFELRIKQNVVHQTQIHTHAHMQIQSYKPFLLNLLLLYVISLSVCERVLVGYRTLSGLLLGHSRQPFPKPSISSVCVINAFDVIWLACVTIYRAFLLLPLDRRPVHTPTLSFCSLTLTDCIMFFVMDLVWDRVAIWTLVRGFLGGEQAKLSLLKLQTYNDTTEMSETVKRDIIQMASTRIRTECPLFRVKLIFHLFEKRMHFERRRDLRSD